MNPSLVVSLVAVLLMGAFKGSHGSFEQDALVAHNNYRRIHQAPDMTLNSEMSGQATAYAAQLAQRGSLAHSSTNDGENLAKWCGGALTGTAATKMWYDEVCEYNYNFASGGFSYDTGHFTQVVWKGSTELGIGKATSGQCTYVVARYRQPGNYPGMFQNNVKQGSFNRQTMC